MKSKLIRFILPVLFLFTIVLIAGTPSLTLLNTTSSSMGTGTFDTVTVSSISMNGDSVGFIVDFNSDSVSGWVQYRFVSPNSYYTQDFSSSTTLTTWGIYANNKAVFTGPVPRVAGNYKAEIYVIFKNNNAATTTVTAKTYSVVWR